MITSTLLYVVAVPLTLAAAAAFVMRWVEAPPRATWAVGVAFGYVAGHLGLKSRSGISSAFHLLLQPHEARDWLPHVVLLAMGVTIIATSAPQTWRWCINCIAVLLTIGVPIRLLAGNVAQRWTILEKFAHLTLWPAILCLVWLLLASARDDQQPLVRTILIALVAGGSAVAITLAGSIVSGQACGVLAAAVAGTALGATGSASALFHPSGTSGVAGPVTFSLGSLILLGHYYAELSAANATLLFLALAAAGGPLPESLANGSTWRPLAIRAVTCLVPVAIAIYKSVA